MTIAVAALWPWTAKQVVDLWDWQQLTGVRSNHFPPRPSAVILLSDSRWTYIDPSSPHQRIIGYEDIGTKLFNLATDAGAVYAGLVDAGEECLEKLASRFSKRRVERPVTTMAQNLFRATYASRTTNYPLRILLGACTPDSIAELWSFESANNFSPSRLSGIQILAPSSNVEGTFLDGLAEVLIEVSPQPYDLTPRKAALWLATALQYYIIERNIDITIGGKIQCAIIDKSGFHVATIARIDKPVNPKILEMYSPRPGELKISRHPQRRHLG